MNHKLANGIKMRKGNGVTTTLLFSLKELEIVHHERRGQMKTIVMEHFNGILFHKSGPAIKQHINQLHYSKDKHLMASTCIKIFCVRIYLKANEIFK